MERYLDLTIELTSTKTFDLHINDPESGDSICIPCHLSGDSVNEENEKIIAEIRDWAVMMAEAAEEDGYFEEGEDE